MEALNVRQQDVACIEMVYRYVEEALDLISMKIHRDQTVDACCGKHVSHELGADAHTRFVFAILASPAEVGDDSDDVACRRALGSINHQQQLHEVVGVGEGALYEEDILTTNRLLIGDSKLTV